MILHYSTGEVRAGGPFINYPTAVNYAKAKVKANPAVNTVIAGPISADQAGNTDSDLSFHGILDKLRKFAGI